MKIDDISGLIIGSAIEVHRKLGPGLLEHAYRSCLGFEFKKKGLSYEEEVLLPIKYEDKTIEAAFRLDMLVESRVVVELKATDGLSNAHKAQLLTYIRLANKPLGLLLNFNCHTLTKGIYRMINSRALVP